MRNNTITNTLSVDVEGFAESNVQSFSIPEAYLDQRAVRFEIERNVDAVLEVLAGAAVRGTFFFVGTTARRIPNLVAKVAALGHEIGSHSYEHTRVFGVDRKEFRERLAASKRELEDLSGVSVYGFRAPDFSITRSSLWALDVLKELGFVYDSSIYPFGLHDVYGIDGTNPSIHVLPNGLVEFPLPTVGRGRTRVPFGGGGYLRLYPVTVTESLVRRANRSGRSCMLYVHPYEVGPVVPKIPGLSWGRRFRHYVNIRRGTPRLRRLLGSFRFAPAIDVLRERDVVPTEPETR
jgi:polysaccharide deacetylase family protein (PEP-CTERM system associated)